jgi:hypothetical protein
MKEVSLFMASNPIQVMEVIENPKEWMINFHNGFVRSYKETGKFDWKKYIRPKNTRAPHGPGIDLSNSRLMLISSAGGYLPPIQTPFEASNVFGDYSIRKIPSSTPLTEFAYAHEHYDHSYVDADAQVLLPLRHLEDFVEEGIIGELAPSMVSFMGYQPNVIRVIKELAQAILHVAQEEQIDAALLVPT